MKENKYDEETFFEKYSRFPRSVEGLGAAGEWHAFQKMLPDFKGKRVLDIGCGLGWHCIYAAEQGALSVLGTDISEKMLAAAREKTAFSNVTCQLTAMEDLDFAPNSFDIVLSSLAFHYTADFLQICRRVYAFLSPGGEFVFSIEHPIFTAAGTQEWIYDEKGHRDHWPVENYFSEGIRETFFLDERVIKYHRTLTSYLNALLETGFTITGIREPEPSADLLETIPDMRDELRRPMMLLISAKKINFSEVDKNDIDS